MARQPDARYFIPNEDEWYKAAYYDGDAGVYYDYPSRSNTAPSDVIVDPDPGNNASYSWELGPPYYRTEVGEFENSESPCGAFDMGGNVWEWNTTVVKAGEFGTRGGSYVSSTPAFAAFNRNVDVVPTNHQSNLGFRIARSATGDFDLDGDIDADDIDILRDHVGNAAYDLDGDGDTDEDDLIYLVENLVELQDGSGRVGTMRGDFTLDGLVNATDLATMKAAYGTWPRDWADGNANCDDIVNATDLAILDSMYGFVAPTGAPVPEPATLGMALVGITALLHRRRR